MTLLNGKYILFKFNGNVIFPVILILIVNSVYTVVKQNNISVNGNNEN